MAQKCIDMSGNTYGFLTTLNKHNERINGKVYWVFECICGNIIVRQGLLVRRGVIKSCGCQTKRLISEANTKYTETEKELKSIHKSMKDRCVLETNSSFQRYGKRGIKYSAEWEDFHGFLNDMLEGYSKGLTLERINPNKDYCKENCVWLDPKFQARNRNMDSRNTSGVTGVYFAKKDNSWVAKHVDLSGNIKSKSFSINKYGEDAFIMACNHRKSMIDTLNDLGAGYSEFHGIEKYTELDENGGMV